MRQFVFILLLGSVAVSCQKSKESAESTVSADSAVSVDASPAFAAEREAFFNNLQAPAEVAAQIQLTEAPYSAKLMNDPKVFAQYTKNEVKAAANMGVYLSDLNYSVAYKKAATTKEYFTAVHELSTVIGGEAATLEFLKKRYNDNIAQNDSVKTVLNDLLAKSVGNLQGSEKERLAGITMSAYQIENLHLVLGTLKAYPKDILPNDARQVILIPLFKMVLEQKSNVENIYNFLKSVSDPQNPDQNPNYPYYAKAFEELIAIYGKLNVDQKIANNQGAELMNDTVVQELSEKVDAIRSKIVSAE